MKPRTTVPWWQRLLLVFCAAVIAWLSTAIVLTCILLWHTPGGRHWFNDLSGGGILETLRAGLIMGGFMALGFYIFLAAPLVLVWPVKSQLKHWYAFLCVAALLPVVYMSTIFWRHPVLILQEIHHNPGILELAWPAIPFLWGIACYLLLLRGQHGRLRDQVSQPLEEQLGGEA
jgi:hypothetical protein